MSFPDRLKQALSAAEKTQRDVSKHLNVAESTVSQWASGKRLPDLVTASRLAEYLRVSVDYLMGRTEIPGAIEPMDKNRSTLYLDESVHKDELVVVFRGKRQKLSPDYQKLLIKMMEAEAEKGDSGDKDGPSRV